jgi:hypothetical protein
LSQVEKHGFFYFQKKQKTAGVAALHQNIFQIIPILFPIFWIFENVFADAVQFVVVSDDAVVKGSLPGKMIKFVLMN